MATLKPVYLKNTQGKHNKFYHIVPTKRNDQSFLQVTYGRIGTKGTKIEYMTSQYYFLINSKKAKGYQEYNPDNQKGSEDSKPQSNIPRGLLWLTK